MVSGATYDRIDDDGLHVTVDGEARVIAADTVVVCAGQDSVRGLHDALDRESHLIGGADVAAELEPSAQRAIRQGTEVWRRCEDPRRRPPPAGHDRGAHPPRARPRRGRLPAPAVRPAVGSRSATGLGRWPPPASRPAARPRLLAAPRGDGHLVVDVPGWRAPELTGAPLRAYLRRLGYDARSWGFGNQRGRQPAPTSTGSRSRLLELVEQTGRPASLVGWSLGGVVAREVARRHPEAVRRVVTYARPWSAGPPSPRRPAPSRPRPTVRAGGSPSGSTPSHRSACP